MHVGYSGAFQGREGRQTDHEMYQDELRLMDLAVDLGFESVWMVEHHFTEYILSPDPIQFLTWFGARHSHVRLGTGVIVLPWHDPVRCAEQIATLDNLSGGRLVLGLGRGLGAVEYVGFRVPMDGSRGRFAAYAAMVIEGLRTGFMEADNEFIRQPRVELRPRPAFSFDGRVYAAGVSPESMPLMAQLGVGVLIVPQKPWDAVRQDLAAFRAEWDEVHGASTPPPAPLGSGLIYVGKDRDRARENAYTYIGHHYIGLMEHYGFIRREHDGVKGYEYYAGVASHIARRGIDGAAKDYADLLPWGTPDEVLSKLEFMRDDLGVSAISPTFSFGGMPIEEAERSLRLFAEEVLPVVKTWECEPLPTPRPRIATVTA